MNAFPKARLLIGLAVALAVAACDRAPPASETTPPAAAAASEQSQPAPAAEAAVATAVDSSAAVATDFVLSTNEPSWNARVEAGVLVLTGLDGERRLNVTQDEALPDGRHVTAQDAAGAIEIRIAPIACQDSMAGASFPYTGSLILDGGTPIPGCARPASDPPPGEPAQE